jgi:hypothetical protein
MISGAKPGYLAEVRDCGSGDVAANAKLIAAAPDLLAAIEAMRVAGGAAEFQAAFDKAKKLAMVHNAELRGRTLADGPVERSGTNLSAGLEIFNNRTTG